MKIKHWFYDNYLLVCLALLVAIFLLWDSLDTLRTWNLLGPAVGSVLGLVYFALQQNLEEIRLFKELFTEFNARYDKMNEALYALLTKPSDEPLESEQIAFLY